MTAAKMQGYAYVGEKRVAEAAVSCQLIDSSRGRGSGEGCVVLRRARDFVTSTAFTTGAQGTTEAILPAY